MNAHARFGEEAGPPAAFAHDQIFIPKPILWMMIGLALFTIVAVGIARATRIGVTREHPAAAVQSVTFRTGAVAEAPIVARLADGRRVRLAGDHQDIFARMILQGITTIRHDDTAPADAPLDLVVTRDGQRLIVDRATGHTIRLAAFGPENGHSFDALLKGATS